MFLVTSSCSSRSSPSGQRNLRRTTSLSTSARPSPRSGIPNCQGAYQGSMCRISPFPRRGILRATDRDPAVHRSATLTRSMEGKGMQNVLWTACWKESEQPVWKNSYLGCSLRRNDLSSSVSRSARDLPELMMTFPTGWERLLDNRNVKERDNRLEQ